MAAGVTSRHGETAQHARLKQLAFIWAQTHGFSACAMEVTLPRCRYRADVAGYRSVPKQVGSTAIFECKQAPCDLRRDNCRSESTSKRLEAICNRRQVLEAKRRGGNTEPESRTLARPGRASCARSFLSVAASRAEIKESAQYPPECRPGSGTSQRRWQHK